MQGKEESCNIQKIRYCIVPGIRRQLLFEDFNVTIRLEFYKCSFKRGVLWKMKAHV